MNNGDKVRQMTNEELIEWGLKYFYALSDPRIIGDLLRQKIREMSTDYLNTEVEKSADEAFAEIGFTFVGLHTEVERGNEFLEYEDVEGRLLYITRYNGNKYDMMADCEEWTDALIDQIRPIAELKRKEMGWGE